MHPWEEPYYLTAKGGFRTGAALPSATLLEPDAELWFGCSSLLQGVACIYVLRKKGHISIETCDYKTDSASHHCSLSSGTPVQNDLLEFFALVDFVNPGILGSLSSYRKIYEEPIIMSREPSSSKV